MDSYNLTLPNTGQFYFPRGSHQGRNWFQLINSTLVNTKYMYFTFQEKAIQPRMGLIDSDYHICTIVYNMCHGQVSNQVFDTHYTVTKLQN